MCPRPYRHIYTLSKHFYHSAVKVFHLNLLCVAVREGSLCRTYCLDGVKIGQLLCKWLE